MKVPVKDVLTRFGLGQAQVDQFGKRLWRVTTTDQAYSLRAAPAGGGEPLFVAAISHLLDHGVPNLPRWRRTTEDELSCEYDHAVWTLNDWVPGHGAILGLASDALTAARDLGALHLAAVGLPRVSGEGRDYYERYVSRCRSRLKALQTYVLILENRIRPTATDRVFASLVNDAIAQAEEVVAGLTGGGYAELAAESRQAGAFIYRNIGEGGLVINPNARPRAYFVDWTACRRDCHVLDLAKLLNRISKGSGGDPDLFVQAYEAYAAVRPPGEVERDALHHALRFPDEFFSVASRYYENKREWSERSFARRLSRAVDRGAALAACAAALKTKAWS